MINRSKLRTPIRKTQASFPPVTDPSPGGGFLHLLPMYSQEGMTGTAIQAALLPWGSPSHMALAGHDSANVSDAIVEIGYEWPHPWLRTLQPMSTFDLEWVHVQRFRSDYVLGRREHPFWGVDRGADPPDISAETADGTVGIECTRLALPQRQQAHGLFRAVRQRIASTPPEHFAALSGHIVYLWFNADDGSIALPFSRPEEEATADLVNSMTAYRPDPSELWIEGSQLPDPPPELSMNRTPGGAAFYCVPMTNAAPDTVLFSYAGFEIGLAFTTRHSAASEWKALFDRILTKDADGSDWLLISAGAPDKRGITYPSEEALAEFLLAHPHDLPELTHLKRVTLHLWGSAKRWTSSLRGLNFSVRFTKASFRATVRSRLLAQIANTYCETSGRGAAMTKSTPGSLARPSRHPNSGRSAWPPAHATRLDPGDRSKGYFWRLVASRRVEDFPSTLKRCRRPGE